MKYFLVYLILINAASFVLMLIDKYKAVKNRWRIRERTFFLLAGIGGSLGCLLGMYTVRHKTKHLSFTLGIPLILSVHILLAIILYSL